ncbi:MAG: oligoendopeptidase F [Candidatus Glassbacteria bacterium]|nr:oligoendopeptidase F [Candidatus Glassbacteria bacterium]
MSKVNSSKVLAGLVVTALALVFAGAVPTPETYGAEVKKAITRDEIDQRYKWRLEDIYPANEDWERDFAEVKKMIPEVEAFSGRLGESPEVLAALFKLRDSLGVKMGKLYVYSHMRRDENTADDTYQALSDRAEGLGTSLAAATSFIVPEILQIDEQRLRGWLDYPGLAAARHLVEDILRTREHTLGPEQEKLLAMSSEVTRSPQTIFSMLDNADIRYPAIEDENGEQVELTKARYQKFLESGDRELRRRAFEAFYTTYNGYENTLAALLSSIVKRDIFYARARNYGSSLEAALDGDNIPVEVYDNVVGSVNQNLSPLHRYVALRKRVLGLDEVHPYDLYLPLFPTTEDEYQYDDAVKLVSESLKPLGETYLSVLKEGFGSNWIDVYETRGKRSGGYSWGSYGTHPYILLNYNGTLHEVFTIAHEMGHALHSHFTRQAQPYMYGDYTIFVAEVASTTNEALLIDHLLKVSGDEKMQLGLLDHYVRQIQGTVYIQALFAEFEREIHRQVEDGGALTSTVLSELCRSLYQKYFGPDLVVDEIYEINWGRIPHFYNNFYVYQYATGFSAAALLSEKILSQGEPAVGKYLQFLKSGSSDYSIELLKRAGVDMTSPEPVVAAARLMDRLLDRMEQLLGR